MLPFVPDTNKQMFYNVRYSVNHFLNRLACEKSTWLHTKGNYEIANGKLETKMVILNYNML